jgi:cytochrome c biogenesis protein CcmG, thiol:disulfide interchange protein DsbE
MHIAEARATPHPAPIARGLFALLAALAFGSIAHAANLDMSAYRGQVVYVDFWASWCGPCKQSFPWIQRMKDTYGERGLTVIAVDLDHDRTAADKFLNRFRPTFEVRFDPKGEIAQFYAVQAMPTSVLIDRRGVTRFTHAGFRPIDGPIYEAQLQNLIAEK